MAENPSDKPALPPLEYQKSEGADTAPVPNGVEKMSVQESKKLKNKEHTLAQLKKKKTGILDQKESQSMAQKKLDLALTGSDFLLGADTWKIDTKTGSAEYNLVESGEVKIQKEIEKAEGEYRDQLQKTFLAESGEVGDDPKQKGEVARKFVTSYVKTLGIDVNNASDEDIKKLSETLPEAYQSLMLNPDIDAGDFNTLRDKIYLNLYRSESEILKKGGRVEDIQKALAENFTRVTGINTTPEQFSQRVAKNEDSTIPSTIPDRRNITTASRGPTGFMAGGSDSGSGEGGSGVSPENLTSVPSDMTKDTYSWRGSGFKMQGPLKGLTPEETATVPLLCKLARQGVNPGGSTGTCYRSVKNHLCAAGYIPTSYAMGQGSAQDAGTDLASAGFTNVGANRNSTQPGDVLVYSGGEHGHIEINTGDGFASDYFSQNPSGRTLIGVWRPPQKTEAPLVAGGH